MKMKRKRLFLLLIRCKTPFFVIFIGYVAEK